MGPILAEHHQIAEQSAEYVPTPKANTSERIASLLSRPNVRQIFELCEQWDTPDNVPYVAGLLADQASAYLAEASRFDPDATSDDAAARHAEDSAAIGIFLQAASNTVIETGTFATVTDLCLKHIAENEARSQEAHVSGSRPMPSIEDTQQTSVYEQLEPTGEHFFEDEEPFYSQEDNGEDIEDEEELDPLNNPHISWIIDKCLEFSDTQEAAAYVEIQAQEIISCLNRFYDQLNPIKRGMKAVDLDWDYINELRHDVDLYNKIHDYLVRLIEDLSDEAVIDVDHALRNFSSRYSLEDETARAVSLMEPEGVPDLETDTMSIANAPEAYKEGYTLSPGKSEGVAYPSLVWHRSDYEISKSKSQPDFQVTVIGDTKDEKTTVEAAPEAKDPTTTVSRSDVRQIAQALRGTERYSLDGGAQSLAFRVPVVARHLVTDEHLDAAGKEIAEAISRKEAEIERAKDIIVLERKDI